MPKAQLPAATDAGRQNSAARSSPTYLQPRAPWLLALTVARSPPPTAGIVCRVLSRCLVLDLGSLKRLHQEVRNEFEACTPRTAPDCGLYIFLARYHTYVVCTHEFGLLCPCAYGRLPHRTEI